MALDVPIYNNTTPQSNVTLFSEDIARDYLDTLQEKTTLTMIPAITFLIILAVVGMFGNSLILLVCWWKIKISPTKIFLMLIAVFDLLTDVLVTPGEVYLMLNFFQYDNAVLCRAYRYFVVFTNIASGSSLTVIASIRYRKVCKPFSRQMSIKEARYARFFVVGMAAIFAIPEGVFYRIELKETDREGILAHRCSIDNRYADTIWPMLYQIILLLLFIICFIPLVVFSVLIVIRAWKFSRRRFTFPDSVCVSASTMGKKNGIAKSVFSIAQPSQMSESVSSDHEKGTIPKVHGTITSSSTSEQGTIPKEQSTIPTSSSSGQGTKRSSSTSEQGMISKGRGTILSSSTSGQGTIPKDQGTIPSSSTSGQGTIPKEQSTISTSITSGQGTISKAQCTILSSSTSVQDTISKGRGTIPSSSTSEQGTISNFSTSMNGTITSSETFSKSNSSTVNTYDKFLRFQSKQRRKIFSRTTRSFVVINVVCILTYVPYFVLTFSSMYSERPGKLQNMSTAQAMFSHLFIRFIFLNSAANAIIYSLCNINFRRSCMKLLKCKH